MDSRAFLLILVAFVGSSFPAPVSQLEGGFVFNETGGVYPNLRYPQDFDPGFNPAAHRGRGSGNIYGGYGGQRTPGGSGSGGLTSSIPGNPVYAYNNGALTGSLPQGARSYGSIPRGFGGLTASGIDNVGYSGAQYGNYGRGTGLGGSYINTGFGSNRLYGYNGILRSPASDLGNRGYIGYGTQRNLGVGPSLGGYGNQGITRYNSNFGGYGGSQGVVWPSSGFGGLNSQGMTGINPSLGGYNNQGFVRPSSNFGGLGSQGITGTSSIVGGSGSQGVTGSSSGSGSLSSQGITRSGSSFGGSGSQGVAGSNPGFGDLSNQGITGSSSTLGSYGNQGVARSGSSFGSLNNQGITGTSSSVGGYSRQGVAGSNSGFGGLSSQGISRSGSSFGRYGSQGVAGSISSLGGGNQETARSGSNLASSVN